MTDTLAKQLAPYVALIGQSETARRSGVSRSMICRWLNGKASLSVSRAEKIARALNVSIEVRQD